MIENRIPNYSELREGKPGYDSRYTINTDHPLHNDPLVDLREPEFGFEGRANSYYARPNKMTGKILPGVPDAPLVRLDIARRLKAADLFLRTDLGVREVLGVPCQLRIADALRPYEVQKFAFEVAWPMVIKSANPSMSRHEVLAEVRNYCAKPDNDDQITPTPHLTGGAVDLALQNANTGDDIDRGHIGGTVLGTAYPDFHEGYHLNPGESDIENSDEQAEVAAELSEIVLGRRVLYYAVTKIGGLYVNPQEIWHYGKGDPLSEYVSGSHNPYYGVANLPDDLKAAMEKLR